MFFVVFQGGLDPLSPPPGLAHVHWVTRPPDTMGAVQYDPAYEIAWKLGCLLVCLFCCFTSQVNSYGHCGTVSSPNHTFFLGKLEQAVNQ